MKKVILLVAFITTYAVSSQAQFVIENFDNTHLGSWTYKGDSAQAFRSNATLSGLSGSVYSGYTLRNSYDQYDNLTYTLNSYLDSSTVDSLIKGKLALSLELATQASAGIQILIKLQNSTLSGAPNYSGNSEYFAITTLGGSNNPYNWEKLTFSLSTLGGNTIPNYQVNQVVVFFAYLTNSGDQFFFDNLQIINPTATTSGTGTTTGIVDNSIAAQNTSIYPNPTNGIANITYVSSGTGDVRVTLNDMVGKELSVIQDNAGGDTFNGQVDVSALSPGIYYVKFQQDGGTSWLKKLVVSK
jgi:hypothetical protein